ncbi:Uncharacterised protein [Kingella potus]|uniref:Dioxygenase n=1 Tax=Kingella potus TaxID=265175 RepID=A0A377R231_9NEIS|nr:dioxygenase [Kingella potus]UOP01326.1 dioxygenase [Kingella potus]STR00361.1 Uncharacterised protein [Kingella potus]
MNEITQFLRTAAPAEARETLEFMLYECSLDEAPDPDTVALWQSVLQERGGKFAALADMCRNWPDTEQP